MSSSYSSTYTSTYTVSDVEKVVRSIKADLIMIAGSTKAMTEDDAKKYAHDIELLAKNNYITTVDVTLMSSYESEVNAVKYLFQTENASGTERPGGVMWPYTPNGRIRIILSPSDSYHKETEKVLLSFLNLLELIDQDPSPRHYRYRHILEFALPMETHR